MAPGNDQFYSDLPLNKISLHDLLGRPDLFGEVPESWHVVITDIKSSTSAVGSGRHESVNLIATGSIVSVLNIAFKANITIPFFFGGDGATFLVPPSIFGQVMRALLLHKANTLAEFNLVLRAGTIPVKQIYEQGSHLRIARLSMSEYFPIPVILGNGLDRAEKWIKGEDYLLTDHQPQEDELDLAGMQCRWDHIPPPENNAEVVTLLVMAVEDDMQAPAFKKVIGHVDRIYGTPQKRRPISVAKLKLKTTFSRLGTEMRATLGKIRYADLVLNWLTMAVFAPFYFLTKKGKTYLNKLVEMSDTLVMDGKINTVISGTAKQRSDLEVALDKLETAGEIVYGLHVSNSSVMSCYVRDLQDGHIHFVDGSEGGYTMAAGMLKKKLKAV